MLNFLISSFSNFISFINSPAFSGVATIFTGFVVVGVYLWQKRDFKIQAARVLLTEIRMAENNIEKIKDKITNNSTTDLPSVFTANINWKKYSHLFISDFDQDELNLINSFYDCCEIIEDFAKRNNNYFWITTEERARVTVQKLAEYSNDLNTVASKIKTLTEGMDLHNPMYSPSKTLNGIKDYLTKVPKITTSSCGIKLKKLAKSK